jgi:pilus assembly protein CpaB
MRVIALGLLALALVLGGAAVWGIRSLGAQPGARGGAEMVVVAARPIEFGQTLTADSIKLQPWPKGARPEGSFPTLAEVVGKAPRVALRSIAANEPILNTRVSGPGGRATLSALIDSGNRAVTIRVNDVIGVAGFVLPGDFVDVLLTRPEGEPTAGKQNMRTDVLLESVRVLAVDQLANEKKDDPVVAKAATIEVAPEQAQKLALAAQVGSLSLALRGKSDPMASHVAVPVRVSDLQLGSVAAPPGAPAQSYGQAVASQTSVSRATYGQARRRSPRPARPAAERAASGSGVIEIVRGSEATQVHVGGYP